MREVRATSRFHHRLKSFLAKHPEFESAIDAAIERMRTGTPVGLRVHALHGSLKGAYAASISRAYRLIFTLEPDVVTFIDIGSHDEVY